MKLAHLTVAAACIGMVFVSCQKDKDLVTTGKHQTSTEKSEDDVIAQMFRDNLAKMTEVHKFEAEQGGEWVTSEGAIITVHGGTLTHQDGTPASGTVIAKFALINSTADAALTGFGTQSVWNPDTESGSDLLQTGGSFALSIETPDGEQLTAEGDNVTIAVPADPEVGVVEGMTVWEGTPSADQPRDNNWEEQPNEHPINIGQQYYLVEWEGRQRLNIDKLFQCSSAAPVPFRVDLPAGYNNTNSEVYFIAAVCNQPGPKAVFCMDVYNALPPWWSEHGIGAPNGTVGTFVAIAKISGGYRVGSVPAVITGPLHWSHITSMSPITAAALPGYLNSF